MAHYFSDDQGAPCARQRDHTNQSPPGPPREPAQACWARAGRGSTRPGRPTLPISSDPPVNAATAARPPSTTQHVVRCLAGCGDGAQQHALVHHDGVAVDDGRAQAMEAPAGTR
jgi:hypothetical protein